MLILWILLGITVRYYQNICQLSFELRTAGCQTKEWPPIRPLETVDFGWIPSSKAELSPMVGMGVHVFVSYPNQLHPILHSKGIGR